MTARKQSSTAAFHRLGEAGTPPGGPFVMLVPGAEVPLMRLDLPPGLRGHARDKVARLQICDKIGQQGGQLDIRPYLAAGNRDGWHSILLADKSRLGEWRGDALAQSAGCLAMIPDYLALPAGPDIWTVQTEGEQVLVRLGIDDGFAAEAGLAVLQLTRAAIKAAPKAVLRIGPELPVIEAMLAGLNLPVVRDDAGLKQLGLAVPLPMSHGEAEYDLRHNPEEAIDRFKAQMRGWFLPIALALAALVVWSAAEWIGLQRDRQQADSYQRQMIQLTRENFIPTGPILDVQRQISAAMAGASRQSDSQPLTVDPMELLQRSASVLVDLQAQVSRVVYQNGAGLTVFLKAGDFAALDRIVGALGDAGLAVLVDESSASESAGVSATLVLTPREATR